MKKILTLRDWLTLEEAAEHLSMLFDERVVPVELLRLALDGELTLSVRFVNHAHAKRAHLVSRKEQMAELKERMAKFPDLDVEKVVIDWGTDIDEDERAIEVEKDIVTLTGVWDLPMWGSERLDVEHEYQMLTSGPAVDLQCLEGPIVSGDGSFWQIQDHYSDNEYVNPDRLKTPWGHPENFYPAAKLPSGSVYVVRPSSLNDLVARVQEGDQDVPLNSADPASEPQKFQKGAQSVRGRRMSRLWPDWVAELVLHLHENGFPEGEGASGQDALIAAVEDKLAQRNREAPSRTTVQEAVRAVLVRYREAGK